MKEELVQKYREIFDDVFLLTNEREASAIVEAIENLDDEATDVRKEFIENRKELKRPLYWIALIRVMRLSYVLRKELQDSYDEFVNIYQELSQGSNLSSDEKQLYGELGDFLYRVDDLFGDHDRYVNRMLMLMRQGIMEDYGLSPEQDEEFYMASMSRDVERKHSPVIDELFDILDQFVEQVRVMNALERLRSIIIPDY